MPVVRIKEVQNVDQVLEAGHQYLADMSVHEVAGTLQSTPCQITARSQNGFDPFFVDGIGPFRPIEVRHGELHQEIAEWGGIENGGVQKSRRTAQASVSHAQLLRFGGQLVEHLAALPIDILFVCESSSWPMRSEVRMVRVFP